jgi:hypothetical protein
MPILHSSLGKVERSGPFLKITLYETGRSGVGRTISEAVADARQPLGEVQTPSMKMPVTVFITVQPEDVERAREIQETFRGYLAELIKVLPGASLD